MSGGQDYDPELDDPVKHPNHYTQGKIEVIDFIKDQKMSYCEGNVIKYVSRYKFKNGLEDLKKARQYLDWLIEENTSEKDDSKKCLPRSPYIGNWYKINPTDAV